VTLLLAIVVLAGLTAVSALFLWNLCLFRRAAPVSPHMPAVSILIPARDEAGEIEGAVRAACAQTAPDLEVIVLDDGSTDGTSAILLRLERELPRLRVEAGVPLPPGWAGKAWACWQLARIHARHPWVLFVDCDVRLAPDAAARALAEARARKVDFLSGFPRQMLGSPGEALLVPLMYLVLLSYLPLAFIRRVKLPSLSAGCGQFMLVRRAPYLEAGGHGAVRRTLHDGIMLARRMKSAGFPVGVFDAWDIARCRMYAGFRSCWRGFSRNAYEALGSPLALGAMIALNGAFFVLPFLAAPWALAAAGLSPTAVVWAAAVALALGLRVLVAVRFSAPMWTVVATPVAVALLIGLQMHSFVNHCTGRPVVWRARAYPGAAPSRRT
jgi:cellulose synthase/poly-beta-1,6-N-acetylglucosamine synthase-like glycosyltransferase